MDQRKRPYYEKPVKNEILTGNALKKANEIGNGFGRIVRQVCQANSIPCEPSSPVLVEMEDRIRIICYPSAVSDDRIMARLLSVIIFDAKRIIRTELRIDVQYCEYNGRRAYIMDLVG